MDVEKHLRIIKENIVELLPEEELICKLKRNKPLRIKWGADPSAPDIHLGHTVVLNKLKQFQDLGHHVIFLIGDFTAMIGDPTGKSETRPILSPEEVKENAKTYQKQVFKILDPKKTEVVYNSNWLADLKMADLINLAGKYTVARMLEREDFMTRFEKERPISIHEFLYPLIQGYDSVHLKSDLEIGGTDQKFNLLVGRELQREFKQEPQVILTVPILEGTDGVQKMSKSLGNYIGVTEPPSEIFGKTMSISDALMHRYFTLLTEMSPEEIKRMHPKEAKMILAKTIVARFYDEKKAIAAEQEFEAVFKEKKLPQDILLIKIKEKKANILDLMVKTGLASSKGEARRLISQGGVRVNDQKVADDKFEADLSLEIVLNVGKLKYVRVICG
ncbi:tyrosine--tRNA ligase [candidate division WOR-1 bacterium RIFOXYA12_FULL_43_27]|uniref:Tyrosine--tRNA ligase n=1 Tax=candidate division WOR-1 bacterium RIFOXYC2_FULL_46_14 TaxID=1802587 RepID=A0A1F4U6B3_UNCSA|nr:MAG: tyrosine--tRNA ligase [candidate division WOR-1 bacterium RIFOXYA12_FULL_43_27]OGC20938.1 MAG: tyrosine--tRNA ligase [candidate division WOR-1 bacterium RIFOXYB2_FULL_46_45]OGC32302.1 MAG: tyrosine--tRNA ligase [candidate division WOR-1 bacterium RIFOXYA2_FULL_46_56]OGC40494.1 MAG: tyrosine--tRNA ligase [candidate division WOR-1 bacterium RIFOXYC2_FULL_46_14]